MDALFMAGTVSDNSRLGGGKLKAWDGNITSWQELQGILDDVQGETTIRLTQDLSAVQGVDPKLELAQGKNVILDLNGYTLSRGLTDCSPEEDGHVIKNYGTLTITDSSAGHSGKITGGNSTEQCGAIWNMGTLTLDGAEISGNTSGEEAGGIYNEPWGVVDLISAKITGNTSQLSGGGIYNKGTLNISGASVVSGNSAPDGSNVYMIDYGPALQVTGGLDQDCRIGVTIDRTGDFANGLFTNGLSGRGTAANFSSDDSSFTVSVHDDGEAYLDGAVTVTFDSDGGSEVEAQTVVTGRKAVRPEDPAKAGFTFKDWYQVTDADTGTLAGIAFDFENTAVSESITLKAVWEESSEDTVIIKSANVEFQGKIRLQFALSFPEDVLADEGAYVTFEKAGTITKKLVSEGTAGADSVSFFIPVPAPEYADDIVVRAFDGEDSRLTLRSANGTDYTENGFAYSVRTYAQNKSQSGSTEEMRALAKALDNYGTASQIYFQYGDYSGLSADAAVTAVTLEDLAPYALTTSGTKPAGVTGASIVVEFDTDNTLRITFKTDGSRELGGYTFLLDGTETVPEKSGKNEYLQVKNIAAPNLDTAHTFTVTDGTDTYTVTASALSYGYTSVKNGDEERQNLGKALYLYNQAADEMFSN